MNVTFADDWTDPTCPVARTVDLVGDRWSLLIIRDAMDGATTFTQFRRLGIARNILTDRLRRLVARGILTRDGEPTDARSHRYRLTAAGADLFTTVVALRQWGERHAFDPTEPHSTLRDDSGQPLPELRPRDSHGREATVATTAVDKPT